MGLERIVEIGKSAYQTSKNIIKAPRTYFVAPLALAAVLSYSSKINAGTFKDDFDNNQFDTVNYSVNPSSRSDYVDEVGTWTRLNEEYGGVPIGGVEVNFKKVIGPIDSYTIEINANILPEDGRKYVTQITDDKGTPETSDDVRIDIGYFDGIIQDRHEFGVIPGGSIGYINASTGLTKITYKFTQDANGNISAYAKEDNGDFVFIGVADATTYNIGLDNLIPSFYGYFDNANGNNASGGNAYQFDLLELKGANIENNNLALTTITNLILFSLLFGIPLKELLKQKEN